MNTPPKARYAVNAIIRNLYKRKDVTNHTAKIQEIMVRAPEIVSPALLLRLQMVACKRLTRDFPEKGSADLRELVEDVTIRSKPYGGVKLFADPTNWLMCFVEIGSEEEALECLRCLSQVLCNIATAGEALSPLTGATISSLMIQISEGRRVELHKSAGDILIQLATYFHDIQASQFLI